MTIRGFVFEIFETGLCASPKSMTWRASLILISFWGLKNATPTNDFKSNFY
jgi:hypothetical protein